MSQLWTETELRIEAMQMAVEYCKTHPLDDVIEVAKKIYLFYENTEVS